MLFSSDSDNLLFAALLPIDTVPERLTSPNFDGDFNSYRDRLDSLDDERRLASKPFGLSSSSSESLFTS